MNFKFRGISIATGCWVYGGIYSANDIFYIIEPIGYNTPVIPGTVSMLTGKKDKNGKDIYQGDINNYGGIVVWNWDIGGFFWKYSTGTGDMRLMGGEQIWCQIVGNEHNVLEPGITNADSSRPDVISQ